MCQFCAPLERCHDTKDFVSADPPPTVYHLWSFSLSGLRAYGALILFPVFWMATCDAGGRAPNGELCRPISHRREPKQAASLDGLPRPRVVAGLQHHCADEKDPTPTSPVTVATTTAVFVNTCLVDDSPSPARSLDPALAEHQALCTSRAGIDIQKYISIAPS